MLKCHNRCIYFCSTSNVELKSTINLIITLRLLLLPELYNCALIIMVSTVTSQYLTITHEPGICSGEYLSHKTLPMTSSTGEVMAQHVYDALEEFDSLDTLEQYWLTTPLSTQAGRMVWL